MLSLVVIFTVSENLSIKHNYYTLVEFWSKQSKLLYNTSFQKQSHIMTGIVNCFLRSRRLIKIMKWSLLSI